MTRSDHLTALLAKYRITPCGSHSCIFGNPANHVGPNGPCQCHEELFGDGRTMRLDGFRREVMRLAAVVRDLDRALAEQPEQIAAWLERELGGGGLLSRYGVEDIVKNVRAIRWKEQDRG